MDERDVKPGGLERFHSSDAFNIYCYRASEVDTVLATRDAEIAEKDAQLKESDDCLASLIERVTRFAKDFYASAENEGAEFDGHRKFIAGTEKLVSQIRGEEQENPRT